MKGYRNWSLAVMWMMSMTFICYLAGPENSKEMGPLAVLYGGSVVAIMAARAGNKMAERWNGAPK